MTMKSSARSRRGRRGFTLIEVLLVLTILVIIGSFAVTNYMGVQNQAKISQAKVQIQNFKTPLLLYRQAMGEFPPTEMGLGALLNTMTDDKGRIAGASWIDSLPLDPWQVQYMYQFPGTRGRGDMPDIWSNGPDRTPNTEDDIGNWQD